MESFNGYVSTVYDALLLIESCRRGLSKRIERRLSEREKVLAVRSGAVFVWDEEEAQLKRWTDGRHWTSSRVSDHFLVYYESDERPSTIVRSKLKHSLSTGEESFPMSDPTSPEDTELNPPALLSYRVKATARKKGGLVKKAITVKTADHRKHHLVCYYTSDAVSSGTLRRPVDIPSLSSLPIDWRFYPDFAYLHGDGDN
ncbi:hypothetical protein HK102_012185, partial [Quaeritorhiza haematococci]